MSERVWGYVLSYKDDEKVKHFLIDAAGTGYQFFGSDAKAHVTLYDLIAFHRVSWCITVCYNLPIHQSMCSDIIARKSVIDTVCMLTEIQL